MKTKSTIIFTIFTCGLAFAQTLQDATYKTGNERFSEANSVFNSLLAAEPKNGNYYFYKGENFYEWSLVDKNPDYVDSAKAIWNKGLSLAPEHPLSLVAQGKIQWLNNDQVTAKATFSKVVSSTKSKNAEVLRNIAETYIECPNKSLDDAIALLTTAIKIDPKNEDAHLFMGDALLAKTPENGSESIKYYNEVLKINPKSPTGLVRIGNLYRQARSFSAANEKYIEAISIDSTYAPAYRESAELYFQYDKAESAIKNWEKYLSLNNGNEARYRYATSLFIANKFCAAITEIENLQAKNFNNYYMERILAYCYYECSKTGNMEASLSSSSGLKALDRYFAIVPKDKIIYQDYKYKGLLLTLSGSDSLAILELEKGYELNPESHEILSEIAKLQFKAKKFNDAIVTFNKKKTLVGLTVLEYYDLGRAYYFGPKNYAAADSAFASLIEFSDSYYPAYLWRARNMYYLDTVESNYSQKPYYEKVYELITKDDKNSKFGKTAFIESARYLGRLYSFESSPFKDIEKAKNCWNAILELDPADVESLTFFKENPN